jgi:hypothetical protein
LPEARQSLTVTVDGTELTRALTSVAFQFDAPAFVKQIRSTSLHPFAVGNAFQPEFWQGEIVLRAGTAPGTRGRLTVRISGRLNDVSYRAERALDIVAGKASRALLSLVLPRPDDQPPTAGAAILRQVRPGSRLIPGTGVAETIQSWHFGRDTALHLSRTDNPTTMLPATVEQRFVRGGRNADVEVTTIVNGEPADPVAHYRFDVTQRQPTGSYSYRIDLEGNTLTGFLSMAITAGNRTYTALVHAPSGIAYLNFPADLEYRLATRPGAPLFGMETSFLKEYSKEVTASVPANYDSISATNQAMIEAMEAVPVEGGAPSGPHPNWACGAACFACGATLFMGPTCTQWVDCIDWAENPRVPVTPVTPR